MTKKSFAEQKPQSRMTSISDKVTTEQVKKLLAASQQVVSCKPKSCELRNNDIARQPVMNLSYCKLLTNKLASCKPVSL